MASDKESSFDNDPLDLSHLFSHITKNRAPSQIKQFYQYFAIPGIGQLAGGLPNDHYFPYDTLEAKVALADRWQPSSSTPGQPPEAAGKGRKSPSLAESHIIVPHTSVPKDPLRRIDLTTALQYGQALGYPALHAWVKEFALKHLHPTIPYQGGADVILTCGSTDGFSKFIQCFNNEWVEGRDPIERKEGLLVEEFAYMNAVQTARPRGMNIVPVALDKDGMQAAGAGGLEDVLANWDAKKGRRPHLLYTVTIGQNPTSTTLPTSRRKELYKICQKYDVVIVEDDPYWYLQFPSSMQHPIEPPPKSSGFPFLDAMQPSFLSIDVDGRVVRLDTFSKTVAPGCRLGWITASPQVCERLLRITETSTQQPSGFVQSMIAELVLGPSKDAATAKGAKDKAGWDFAGWVRWLEGLRGEYERRMDTMATILEAGRFKTKLTRPRSLTRLMRDVATTDGDVGWAVVAALPMYEFQRPSAGMFLWVQVLFETHPLADEVQGARLSQALWIYWTTEPFKVLAAPGLIFAPSDQILEDKAWRYFRLCFAAAPVEDLRSISERFVQGIDSFWRIKDVKKIDDILKEIDNPPAQTDETKLDARAGLGDVTGWC